jgi:hypothetical protein
VKPAALTEKHLFAERLRPLLDDFRFTWCSPAVRSDGIVTVSVHPTSSDEGTPELLVSVFDGLPPPPSVHGLPWTIRRADTGTIVRVGNTDRGRFWLAGLAPGEYRLEIESLIPGELIEPRATAAAPQTDWSAGQITPAFAEVQYADKVAEQEFTSDDPDQTVRSARITQTREGRLTLDVEIQSDSELWGKQPLARFRIWNDSSELLAQGYIGLYSLVGGRAFGKLDLDGFAPDLRSWLPARCYLRIDPQDPRRLVAQDRDDLEQSLACTDDPRCREAVAAALGNLPPSGQRPAFGEEEV